jgi:3-hydroxyacyl-CoA dehydrogenase
MTDDPLIHPEHRDGITVLRIDHPPVNALSPRLSAQLGEAIMAFEADRGARALVIACAGRTFVAGGDIAAFDDPAFSALPLNRTLARMEQLDRPVVAAIHGFALGGGLELALACHWRIAAPGTQLGLPEVKLGLLPGSLGSQRLPRVVGLALAYDLIASGRSLDARDALACGLLDAVADEGVDIADTAVAFANQMLVRGTPPPRVSTRTVDTRGLAPGFFDEARRRARTEQAAYPAALAIVDALEASTLPFAQGEAVEAQAFEALRLSPQSQALRYLFFARRRAARAPALPEAVGRRMLQAHERAAAADPQDQAPRLYALIDEGCRVLGEGLAPCASAIDVLWTQQYGFPDTLGGPMFHADTLGLARIAADLQRWGQEPAPLLQQLAAGGARLRDWTAPR